MLVSLLLQVPPSRICVTDKLICITDAFGQFHVRSTYVVARKLLGREEVRIEYESPIWRLVDTRVFSQLDISKNDTWGDDEHAALIVNVVGGSKHH